MSRTLKENLNSTWVGASHGLYSRKARRRIVAYVESYDDISFWRTLFNEFENDRYFFQVMLPSSISLAKGKKMALMNSLGESDLGENMIACVDSDYDYLLQGATRLSRKIIRNPYIFHTYTYAIENYQCFAGGLHEVCVQATLNDRHLIDFTEFMKRYSRIAYPLFLWSVWFNRQRMYSEFSLSDFCSYIRLYSVDLKDINRCLDEMNKRVKRKLSELSKAWPEATEVMASMRTELEELGVTPENTYLFIQGHHIMDNVVMKILTPVCTVLRRERENEIKLLAGHDEQFRNELTSYQNSLCNVEVVLRKNTNYKESGLYKQLQKDVEEFLKKVK